MDIDLILEPDLTPAEVYAFLSTRLERYKLPDVLYFARELPAGRTGKADRGRFAAMLEANELVAAGEAPHEYESIRLTRDGHVAVLELHQPDRLNALGKSMLLEINHAMDALEADPDAPELRRLERAFDHRGPDGRRRRVVGARGRHGREWRRHVRRRHPELRGLELR